MNKIQLYAAILCLLAAGASSSFAQQFTPERGEQGIAMFYADYLHGQSTALGEIYYKEELTCSHPYHPKGTLLKVTRLDNGRSVTVRVNDRGTFHDGVIIDLSFAAAMEIDLLKNGKAWVRVEPVGYSETNPVNPNRARLTQPVPSQSPYGTEFTARGITSYDPSTPSYGYRGPAPSGALRGGYGIQVGAYTVYDNAVRCQEGLRNQGAGGISIQETYRNDGSRLFRVVIGSFQSRTDAETYLRDFLKPGYIADGVVVQLN